MIYTVKCDDDHNLFPQKKRVLSRLHSPSLLKVCFFHGKMSKINKDIVADAHRNKTTTHQKIKFYFTKPKKNVIYNTIIQI